MSLACRVRVAQRYLQPSPQERSVERLRVVIGTGSESFQLLQDGVRRITNFYTVCLPTPLKRLQTSRPSMPGMFQSTMATLGASGACKMFQLCTPSLATMTSVALTL